MYNLFMQTVLNTLPCLQCDWTLPVNRKHHLLFLEELWCQSYHRLWEYSERWSLIRLKWLLVVRWHSSNMAIVWVSTKPTDWMIYFCFFQVLYCIFKGNSTIQNIENESNWNRLNSHTGNLHTTLLNCINMEISPEKKTTIPITRNCFFFWMNIYI